MLHSFTSHVRNPSPRRGSRCLRAYDNEESAKSRCEFRYSRSDHFREMNPKAIPTPALISRELIDSVTALASASTRRRMNHNFHSDAQDNPHRFLNVLLQGTYIRPHRHVQPPKSESFVVLEGAADVIVFNDSGTVSQRYTLGPDSPCECIWGIDLAPGVWHTILARSARAVCYEVKAGHREPASDKEFAGWAPDEGDPSAEEYVRTLLEAG